MSKLLFILLSLLVLGSGASALEAKLVVIVNKSVKDTSFSKPMIRNIQTMSKQYWKDGSRIVLIDYKGEGPKKKKYYKALGLSINSIRKIWLRKQFSGKAIPPQTFNTEKEVLETVANTPGAIGYISAEAVTDDVVVIGVIE